MLLTQITILDAVLNAHAAELGDDFTGYTNHTYRVVNLCVALCSGNAERLEKIAIEVTLTGSSSHFDERTWSMSRAG